MSTPIKPPDRPSSDAVGAPDDGPERGRIEGQRGELRSLVDDAEAEMDPATAEQARGTAPSHLGDIERDLAAGRIDADEAIDRIVSQALDRASALPTADRAALEAQLRMALREDPTLIALQKDLERGSTS